MAIVPLVASSRRLIMRNVVVLPQPDGPINTINSPLCTSSDRSFTAGRLLPGYTLLTFWNVTPIVNHLPWLVNRGVGATAMVDRIAPTLQTGHCLQKALHLVLVLL